MSRERIKQTRTYEEEDIYPSTAPVTGGGDRRKRKGEGTSSNNSDNSKEYCPRGDISSINPCNYCDQTSNYGVEITNNINSGSQRVGSSRPNIHNNSSFISLDHSQKPRKCQTYRVPQGAKYLNNTTKRGNIYSGNNIQNKCNDSCILPGECGNCYNTHSAGNLNQTMGGCYAHNAHNTHMPCGCQLPSNICPCQQQFSMGCIQHVGAANSHLGNTGVNHSRPIYIRGGVSNSNWGNNTSATSLLLNGIYNIYIYICI